jgi:hypothetical protein
MLIKAHDPAGFPDIGKAGDRLSDIRQQAIDQSSGPGGTGMAGYTIQQDLHLIDPRGEGRSGVGIAVRDEITGEYLQIRSAALNGSGQNHKIAVRAKLVRGVVHPPVS